MTSYNLLNSVHASESEYLNYTVLRDMWGFDGISMSDWTSVYSPLNAGRYGVDLEMPRPEGMKPEIMMELIQNGVLPVEAIDRKCQHIIQAIFAYEFDKNEQLDKSLPENNPYCDSISHELSRAAIVMLKNENNILPIKKGEFVVCGPNSDKIVTGGGSGHVTPLISSPVATGMANIDKKIKSTLFEPKTFDMPETSIFQDKAMATPGVKVEFFNNLNLEGEPSVVYTNDRVFISSSAKEAHEDLVLLNVSTRHTFFFKPEKDLFYRVHMRGNDGSRMYINGEKLVDDWTSNSWQYTFFDYEFKAGQTYEVVVEHFNRTGTIGLQLDFEIPITMNPAAIKSFQDAEYVVLCLGHSNLTEKKIYEYKIRAYVGNIENKMFGNFGELLKVYYEPLGDGHDYVEDVTVSKAATCTETGYYKGICSFCKSTEEHEVPAFGHTEVIISGVPASCNESGISDGKKCAVCGEITLEQATIPATHSYPSDWQTIISPTCTKTGIAMRICRNCADIQTNTLDAVPHADSDGNYKCDMCSLDMSPADPSEGCSCNCHNDSFFTSFIWKITIFFNKLFKKNAVCACGIAHY